MERYGAVSAIIKAQIDRIPLSEGAVNTYRNAGMWWLSLLYGQQADAHSGAMDADVRPPQSLLSGRGSMRKPSSWYARIADVTDELFKITLLRKGHKLPR